MFEKVREISDDRFSFEFSGQKWEVRKNEEGFFLEDIPFSFKQFLLVAAPHLYRKRERKVYQDAAIVFPKLSGTLRSEIALAQERTILPDIPLSIEQREEVEALGGALKWLLDVSTKSTDIARTWRTYQRVYGKEDLYGAAYHLCCYGRPPSYRNPPVESNTLVEVTPRPQGIVLYSSAVPVDFKRMFIEAVSAALLYEVKNKGTTEYSEDDRAKVFSYNIYTFQGKRVSLTPETREAVFKAYLGVDFGYLAKHPELDLEPFLDIPGAVFESGFELFVSHSDWKRASYTMSGAALAQRQETADKKNWEKFCRDILPRLDDESSVISTKELAKITTNYRAIRKWKEFGYLVEVPELREGRTLFFRCPLLAEEV